MSNDSQGNNSGPLQAEFIAPPQLSPELWQALCAQAEKAGLPVPLRGSGAPEAPTMKLEKGWRWLGHELGGILRRQNIFLKAGELGRVNEVSGRWELFTPHNFAGWVEEFVGFTRKGERVALHAEDARMLMSQFSFLGQMRELEGIHLMSLPVLRADWKVEWLGRGYDEGTRIFTVPTLEYDMGWDVDRGREWFEDWCGEYPWMRADDEEGKVLSCNRSYAAHLTAMVGVYCRAMVEAGQVRPMFLYLANQPESGKSTAAQMAFIPVFGMTASNDLPRNDDELMKELAAASQNFTPFLFLDEVGGFLSSTKLNRFISSPRHSGRILGTKDRFDVPNVTQVFATGNNVSGSRDLARRSIIVEMFYAGDLSARKFKRVITPQALSRPEVRRGFLSALCSFVKHWAGKPVEERKLSGLKPLASFEEWTSLMASIVMHAGYTNPLAAPLTPFDEEADQGKLLLIAAADGQEGNFVFNREDLVTIAREKELLEDVVGMKGGKELDGKANKRFGLKLRALRGLELVDSRGRRFRFGHRRQKTGATYPLTFL